MNETFRRIAHKTTEVTGSAWAFIASLLVLVVWLVTGSISDGFEYKKVGHDW